MTGFYAQVSGRDSGHVAAQASAQASAQLSVQVSDQRSAQVSDQRSARLSAQVSDQRAAQLSAQGSDRVAAQVPAQVSDGDSAHCPAQVSGPFFAGQVFEVAGQAGRCSAEEADPYCLDPGEAENLLAGHPWRRFAVLGDSIAEGVAEPVPGYCPLPFADRVAAELARVAPELLYLNLGQRGLRSHEVRAGQLDAALAFGPDLALVACGANDALRPGYESRADQVDAEQGAVIRALQAAGALVVTVSIFVRPAYPSLPAWLRPTGTERMAMLGERTRALAAELGTVHLDLARHPIASSMDSTSSDGLHGNGRAQSVAAAEMVRALGALLRAPVLIQPKLRAHPRTHHGHSRES